MRITRRGFMASAAALAVSPMPAADGRRAGEDILRAENVMKGW